MFILVDKLSYKDLLILLLIIHFRLPSLCIVVTEFTILLTTKCVTAARHAVQIVDHVLLDTNLLVPSIAHKLILAPRINV